jgi:hypothetical protein
MSLGSLGGCLSGRGNSFRCAEQVNGGMAYTAYCEGEGA